MFHYCYQLAISIKQGQRKVIKFLWKLCMCFFCLHSVGILLTMAKFVDKKNVTVVRIRSTWLLDIWVTNWAKTVAVELPNSAEDMGMLKLTLPVSPRWSPGGEPKFEATRSFHSFVYKTIYKTQIVITFCM